MLLKVILDDVLFSSLSWEPISNFRSHRLKFTVIKGVAAVYNDLFVLVIPIHDRRFLSSGILSGKLDRGGQPVIATPDVNHDSALGQSARRLDLPDLITRAFDGLKRTVDRAGVGVITIRRHKQPREIFHLDRFTLYRLPILGIAVGSRRYFKADIFPQIVN